MLPLTTVIDWVLKISRALQVIHAHGCRYLDLKPSNLLLSHDGLTLKVADFGNNRPSDDGLGHSFVGTMGWRAPEQFYPASAPDGVRVSATYVRNDFFTLGMLLYYLVTTGDSLRFGSDCMEVFRRHGNQSPPMLRSFRPMTLNPSERQQFRACWHEDEGSSIGFCESTWYAGAVAVSGSVGSQAQALLEQFLAAEPDQRSSNIESIIGELEALQLQLVSRPAALSAPFLTPRPTSKSWLVSLVILVCAAAALLVGTLVAQQPLFVEKVDAHFSAGPTAR